MRTLDINFSKFLEAMYEEGIAAGRQIEHDIKKRTCKYFRHQGGALWYDGCFKRTGNCNLEDCPAKDEDVISVR